MKLIKLSCLSASILFAVSAAAQTTPTVTFLDYHEKKSSNANSGYYVITTKKPGDNNWERTLYYNDTIQGFIAAKGHSSDETGLVKEGPFVYFHKNGTKWKEGNFVNNKEEGIWNAWNEDGKPVYLKHYKTGKLVDKNLYWFDNGNLKDSIVLDENGNGSGIEFYKEERTKKAEGLYTGGEKQGLWHYYYSHIKNQVCSDVVFEKDSAVSIQCFTEEGTVQKKDCILEREAKFPGGDEGWKKYLIKKLTKQFDAYAKLMRANQVYTTIVKFAINKEGELFDVRVEIPNNPRLDNIAIAIIKESPAWIPAVEYNFKVTAYRRQPITFVTTE